MEMSWLTSELEFGLAQGVSVKPRECPKKKDPQETNHWLGLFLDTPIHELAGAGISCFSSTVEVTCPGEWFLFVQGEHLDSELNLFHSLHPSG